MSEIFENIREEKVEYFTVGNREFKTEQEAEEFIKMAEEKLEMTYFNVTFSPDLTEGRGYYEQMIIATNSHLGKNLVYDYLYRLLGNSIAWVQGCSPMPNYRVSDGKKFEDYDELEKYLNETYSRLGSSVPLKKGLVILGTPTNETYTLEKSQQTKEQLSNI